MMLTFATECPVEHQSSATDFIAVTKRWLVDSPFTKLSESDLLNLRPSGEFVVDNGDQRVQSIGFLGNSEVVAVRNVTREGAIEWVTNLVYSKSLVDTWVSIRTARESFQPAVHLPAAKKPLAVRLLLDGLGGAPDGPLVASSDAHRLGNDDIELAGALVRGEAGCHLPVVYVSAGFDGRHAVDVGGLSNDLSGMAHVVTEPNRAFSRRLQIDVKSGNVYGGAIGIYWPDGTGRRVFFPGRQYDTSAELKWAVIDEIRAALLNRRPMYRCTWEAAEDAARKDAYEQLRAGGSQELSTYVATFDAEIKAKDARLEEAEREIKRLGREIARQQAASSGSIGGITLRPGTEQDLFGGELQDVVVGAISECADRSPHDSRRSHILRSIAAANPVSAERKVRRDELKKLLRDYRSMDAGTRAGLEAMGFAISEEGKHYKLVYQDDERYTFALAKSGSDKRGGLNSVSDIAKRIL